MNNEAVAASASDPLHLAEPQNTSHQIESHNLADEGNLADEDVRDAAEGYEDNDVAQTSASTALGDKPSCFLIVYNVSKRHNVGTLARCATAFGVKEVCLVGSNQFNSFGSHGAADHVSFKHFASLESCVTHLKEKEGCTVVGIEITPDAAPVHKHPFKGNTAFMLGNEGQGMSTKQMSLCDEFVYIPQHGVGTASLNVAVAASLVLHHFAIWAAYPEREREGAKFVVAQRPVRTSRRGVAMTVDGGQVLLEHDEGTHSLNGDTADVADALPSLFDDM